MPKNKRIILLAILQLLLINAFISSSYAQKASLDVRSYLEWPKLEEGEKISPDGSYIVFSIFESSIGRSTVVRSTFNDWEYRIKDVGAVDINSKYVFAIKKDSLIRLTLGTDSILVLDGVRSFKINQNEKIGGYCYFNISNDLIVTSKLGRSSTFNNVVNYSFSPSGRKLLLVSKSGRHQSIDLFDMLDNNILKIADSIDLKSGIAYDKTERQVAFVLDHPGYLKPALGYYDLYNRKLTVTDYSKSSQKSIQLSYATPVFSSSGNYIICSVNLTSNQLPETNKPYSELDIWRYNDKYLSSQKEKNLTQNSTGKVAINVTNFKMVLLSHAGEAFRYSEQWGADYCIVGDQFNDYEFNRIINPLPDWQIVSFLTGERTKIVSNAKISDLQISPDGKWVVYFRPENGSYISYNIITGKSSNISARLPWSTCDNNFDIPGKPFAGFGICGWRSDGKTLLLYDEYDIWSVVLGNTKHPVSITKGYGRKKRTVLRMIYNFRDSASNILVGFNRRTKENGFFKLNLSGSNAVDPLTCGPYLYHLPQLSLSSSIRFEHIPIVSKDGNSYLVRRMAVNESPNLFFTRDFKAMLQLTNLNPEKKYQWMEVKLFKWIDWDNEPNEGLLYVPEGFDKHKKYPLIYSVYEEFSDGLNHYPTPGAMNGPLDISFFVSNGYIVFAPNIRYKIGFPGASFVQSTLLSLRQLKKNSWVDSDHIGIHGHSFGGYEVNYLITKTNLFAAASSAAGVSDLVSGYGSLNASGNIRHILYEQGQSRIGQSLFSAPKKYIDNSVVFNVKRITTPLLIMHNKNDEAVPWSQAIELFTGMKRANKFVWLLQYNLEGHQLRNEDNIQDYSTRVREYFDYYLKGRSAPKWMFVSSP